MNELDRFIQYYRETRKAPSYAKAVRVRDTNHIDEIATTLGEYLSSVSDTYGDLRGKAGYAYFDERNGYTFVTIGFDLPQAVEEHFDQVLEGYKAAKVTEHLLRRVRKVQDIAAAELFALDVRRRLDTDFEWSMEEVKAWKAVEEGMTTLLHLRRLHDPADDIPF